MVTLVETLNYKCFRYLQQPVGPLQVLAGANGSGKSTFLDIFAFVSDFISEGLKSAIEKRTSHFENLVWMAKPGKIELAIETEIPKIERELLPVQKYDRIRYELAIGNDPEPKGFQIFQETIILKIGTLLSPPERTVFPKVRGAPFTLITPRSQTSKKKRILNKVLGGMETFYVETECKKEKPLGISYKPAPLKSALVHLPDDEKKFPVTIWFRNFMCKNVKRIITTRLFLSPSTIRKAKSELSQLFWTWNELKAKNPEKFSDLMALIQRLFPDLKAIQSIQNEEGRRDLVLEYKNNLKLSLQAIPDEILRVLWMVFSFFRSDSRETLYLIEEPENGLHPKTLQNLIQFFPSVPHAQILFSTHSPIVLDQLHASQILFFAKTPEGIADVIPIVQHPKMKNWKGDPPLSSFFTKDVL